MLQIDGDQSEDEKTTYVHQAVYPVMNGWAKVPEVKQGDCF